MSDPDDLEDAWSLQYSRLARQFLSLLPRRGVLVEVGCGKGQLTIPLAERSPRLKIVGVDSFRGPYSGSRRELTLALSRRILKTGFKLVVSDYEQWLADQPGSKYDAVISSEFLPEINYKRMRRLFVDCWRLLNSGSRTVHSFLSSVPRNERQRRLIKADSNPRWTKTPPAKWFSPTTKQVQKSLQLAGFKKVRMKRLRSGLVIRSAAARQLLRDWDIRKSYWKRHQSILEKDGLEVPDWIIVVGRKP